MTKPSTDPSTTSVPAPAPDKLAPEAAKALLARFEEFKKAVGEGKLANLKALLDPAINDRGARSFRNRTALVVQRIVAELGKGDWSHAKVLDVWWQDASEGLAALMVQVPNDSQIRRQTWILKQGQWYLIPPSLRSAGVGSSGPSTGEREQ